MVVDKIFVSIACYRDMYMQSTIDDLFAKANHPENIIVGCFIQETKHESPLVHNTHNDQVKIKSKEPGSIFSICECRNEALSLLTDEYYVLQTDSHMRFDYGWDAYLINLHKSLPSDKSLLSVYLSDWYVDNDGYEIIIPRKDSFANFTFDKENSKDILLQYKELVPVHGTTVGRINVDYEMGWYLCGHFIFGPSNFFKKIPQPEWVGFWGEELINSLRAFSAGWDVYIPGNPHMYHLNQNLSVDVGRPKLWLDYPQEHSAMRVPTTKKIIDIVKKNTVNEDALFAERTLEVLYERIGYNLSTLFSEWELEACLL